MSPLSIQHHHLRTPTTFLWGIFICSFVICHSNIYWFTNLPSSIFFLLSFLLCIWPAQPEGAICLHTDGAGKSNFWLVETGTWKPSQLGRCPSHDLGLLLFCPGRKCGEERVSGNRLCVQKDNKKSWACGTAMVIFSSYLCAELLNGFNSTLCIWYSFSLWWRHKAFT